MPSNPRPRSNREAGSGTPVDEEKLAVAPDVFALIVHTPGLASKPVMNAVPWPLTTKLVLLENSMVIVVALKL